MTDRIQHTFGARVPLDPTHGDCGECGQHGRLDRYHTYLHCLQHKHDTGTLTDDEIATLLTYAWAGLELKTR